MSNGHRTSLSPHEGQSLLTSPGLNSRMQMHLKQTRAIPTSNGDLDLISGDVHVKPIVGPMPTWKWKQDLYRMQLNAPKPIPLVCDPVMDNTPLMYSTEYFGRRTSSEVSHLLVRTGNYLVRQRKEISDHYVLSFRFYEKILHFRLFYNPISRMHYVTDTKCFFQLHDLVADGLMSYYMEVLMTMYLDMLSTETTTPSKSKYMIIHKTKLESMAIQPKLQNYNRQLDIRGPGSLEHNFKVVSLKGLNWCDFCANFMWGIMGLQQTLKCEACGYVTHHKCLDKIQTGGCLPIVVDVKGCFGVDLSQLALAQGTSVPWLVIKCVEEIERRGGLMSEGLYRVSGFQEELDALKADIDRDGMSANLSAVVYENINVITGILKLYFRMLPVPLINLETYHALMVDNDYRVNTPEAVGIVRDSLTILPEAHYYTLKYLAAHLSRVANHHEYNKMGVHNLATVFCPSLMPLPAVTQGRVPDMSNGIEALALIISLHEVVFIH